MNGLGSGKWRVALTLNTYSPRPCYLVQVSLLSLGLSLFAFISQVFFLPFLLFPYAPSGVCGSHSQFRKTRDELTSASSSSLNLLLDYKYVSHPILPSREGMDLN